MALTIEPVPKSGHQKLSYCCILKCMSQRKHLPGTTKFGIGNLSSVFVAMKSMLGLFR